ncbi:lipopolysaccharide assembly protein LapA domain-containing protein [Pseudomonas putida]|uniref:lipopolysaccharide assembly protein LapA domain-containing protein n=1 Tax=Pseudomonas putida TaxID=303 RepID=UPI0023658A6A|nr:lipopolysaccharide assembly protein LapA domain-containing protein [Pseudomonas putida]MDD2046472.1 lipopolysaccharide assembly protein LapA domain-containing protein [Pseudomonas putida]
MRNLKRLLFVLFFLVIVLGVLFFVLENQQPVALVFLGWSLPQLPVSVLVLVALLVGLAVGPILALLVAKRRRQIR